MSVVLIINWLKFHFNSMSHDVTTSRFCLKIFLSGIPSEQTELYVGCSGTISTPVARF